MSYWINQKCRTGPTTRSPYLLSVWYRHTVWLIHHSLHALNSSTLQWKERKKWNWQMWNMFCCIKETLWKDLVICTIHELVISSNIKWAAPVAVMNKDKLKWQTGAAKKVTGGWTSLIQKELQNSEQWNSEPVIL